MVVQIRRVEIFIFVFTFVFGFGQISDADDGCAGFLKQSLASAMQASSSHGNSLSTSHLTAQGQQYLRLIEYALENATEISAKQSLLQNIQVATLVPAPINVFANQTSVAGVQLDQIVKRMDITKNLASDWSAVQARLRVILSRFAKEGAAREQSEGDTEWVRFIDQAWKIFLREAVGSAPSWQQIGSDWYLAVSSADKSVYVLKFNPNAEQPKDVLTVAGQYSTGGAVYSSPSWQQIGHEWYLAAGSYDKKVYVLKFDTNNRSSKEALTVAGEFTTGDTVHSSPSWQQVENKWYLAVGSFDRFVYVLKFDLSIGAAGEALTLAGKHLTGRTIASKPSWQQINGEWYLAVMSWDKKVYILKFAPNARNLSMSLTVVGEHLSGYAENSSPIWQQIGEDWYLALGSEFTFVYILKFQWNTGDPSTALTSAGVYRIGRITYSTPSWKQIGGEWYLAIGSDDTKVYVLRFDRNIKNPEQALTLAGEYKTQGGIKTSPSWQQISGEWYLAVGSVDKSMHILKFDANMKDAKEALSQVEEYPTDGWVDSPSWQKIEDDWYLAVGSYDKHLHLIKFGKTVKRNSQ